MAAPIPRDPPVTTATLSVSLFGTAAALTAVCAGYMVWTSVCDVWI